MDFKEVIILLRARDKFAKTRFSEKKELTELRNKLDGIWLKKLREEDYKFWKI